METPKKKAPAPVLKSPRKLTKAERETVTAVSPEHQQAAVDSITYKPLEFADPDYRPRHPDDKRTCVCINEHRNTCIRVSIGRSKVTYIPMDPEGIMVKHCGIDAFNAEWRLTLSDEHPATAAQRYLMSYQALRHISEEARTLLEGISTQGASFVRPSTTTKENTMSAAQKPAAPKKATPPAVPKKGYDKNVAAAAFKAALAPAPKGKAAPAKAALAAKGKATKPAAKATVKPAAKATPAKGKATKPASTRFAGKKIKVLNKDHGAREGTKRQIGMDILINSKTTDEAFKKFDKYEGIDASFIRYAVDNGIIALSE